MRGLWHSEWHLRYFFRKTLRVPGSCKRDPSFQSYPAWPISVAVSVGRSRLWVDTGFPLLPELNLIVSQVHSGRALNLSRSSCRPAGKLRVPNSKKVGTAQARLCPPETGFLVASLRA